MTVPQDPPTVRDRAGRTRPMFSISGFVCAAVALLFVPVLFGVVGVVLGVIGRSRGERQGTWAAITAGLSTLAGMVLGYLFAQP